MALDIITQDIVIDESIGLTDNDIDASIAPYNGNTTLQYLLTLGTSLEVAYKADFVEVTASAGETITSVILTQDSSGTPFSITDGENSGVKTVDGNYVWLFQDPNNADVVIGVIGTADPNFEPDEGGALAFSFGLDSTSATKADLYLVEYVPLFHPNPNNPDDRIDLTDTVFASVTGTSVNNFLGSAAAPGNHDFYLINSANDASKQLLVIGLNGGTANVSTQGFGIDNQSINPGETLQVDFVTGGNLNAGTAAQIQYGSHIETITQAGFTINQITPSNPNDRVDITIRAFNNTGNDQGTNFFDGTATSSVDIVSLKLTGTSGFASVITADGTYATGSGNVTVTGLTGTGNAVTVTGLDNVTTVDITTGSPMDRMQVAGVDANEGCDISEFHFSATSTNALTEEVGSFINFDDDGPTLSVTAAVTVGPAEVVEASGAGGQSQATITPPTFDASAVDGYTTDVSYALALAGAAATGLLTTDGNHAITLVVDSATQVSGKYDSDGDTTLDATAFTVTLSGTTVTLTSLVALEHSNAPQGGGEDNTLDLNGLINVVATVTVTDGDADVVSKQSTSSGLSLIFDDTDPTLSITAAVTVGPAEVVEASGAGGQSQATITPPTFDASAVDGYTTDVSYALALAGAAATGLLTTDGNHAITLVVDSATQVSGKYDSDGDTTLDATAFTVTLSGTTVTLTSLVALEHSNAPQGGGEDNTLDLNGLINVVATVTVTDGDADVVSKQSTSSGLSLIFDDTDPTLSITAAVTVGPAEVVEASGAGGQSQATITPPTFDASAVDGYTTDVSYALALAGAAATGLLTTDGNHAITLVVDSATQVSGKYDSDGDTTLDATAFTVTLSGTTVTLTSLVALEHSNAPQGGGEDNTLDLNGLINVVATVTVTDGDADVVSKQSTSSGLSLIFDDTDPTLSITAAVTVGPAEVVEASGAGGQSQATITPPTFDASAVDGYTTDVSYALALAGAAATGLLTTDGNHAITLVVDSATQVSGKYDSDGDTTLDATAFTVTLSGTTVTLTSLVALEHSNAPQGGGEDNTLDLNGLINVVATVTVTDGDADVVSKQSTSSGLSLIFDDTDPTLSITAAVTVGPAEVVEASGAGGQSQATITPPTFDASAVDGYTTDVSYALALAGAAATGLLTTDGNHAITLVVDSATQVSGKYDSDGDTTLDATAFTVTLSGTTVTLTSLAALEHSNAPQGGGEDNTLDLNGLINVVATVTVTDGDADVVSKQSTSSGLSLVIDDTDPTITKPFDADPIAGGIQTPEHLGNAVGQTASGTFGYDMTDKHTAAEYLAGISDFVDANGGLLGTQIGLTGTVDNAQNPNITGAVATLTAETLTSATFDFSFHYDKDPITGGVQDATAAGTLVFDKVADTYTFTLTDLLEGFSFDVLHTSDLVNKAPIGNTGHPLIVAEQLTPNGDPSPFFVQFTANSTTNSIKFGFNPTGDGATVGDTTFNNNGATHDMITNAHEDWVSATQATNGVAGDTIQKGEALTLRFFGENILGDVNPKAPGGGNEQIDPTAKASGVVIKFDGVGNSEDLVLILDLKDANGNEVTRAVNVQNSDLIKGNANVPFPYSTEFTLDNNDALLILEQNDYTAAGETYQIQGIQIMQSANGLSGTAINLDGNIGANHGSSTTVGLTAWDPTDNDVLKIVDIGFVQQTSGTIDANLDFSLALADADGDTTATQHIAVNVSNDFIV
ncbi:hypothetical protein HB777_02465 [Mesorhizobium loti]|nr:hypothetical protein HB777_02465 [Mesorhizobium loti]